MSIIGIKIDEIGAQGVAPRILRLETTNTVDELLAPGFLNNLVYKQNFHLFETDLALMTTSFAESQKPREVGLFEVTKEGANWSLVPVGHGISVERQKFLGLSDVVTLGDGNWSTVRLARGNYISRLGPGNMRPIIALDVTPVIRPVIAHGFRLESVDVIYAITASDLDEHTVTLDRVECVTEMPVGLTNIAVTGVLETTVGTNPYVTNIVIDEPIFNIEPNSKYVIEITIEKQGLAVYDFYGVMLRFVETIG